MTHRSVHRSVSVKSINTLYSQRIRLQNKSQVEDEVAIQRIMFAKAGWCRKIVIIKQTYANMSYHAECGGSPPNRNLTLP